MSARLSELPPDISTAAASAASSNQSNSSASQKDKESTVDNSDFEEDIKIKQRRHTKSRSKKDDDEAQASSSSNNSSSSSSSAPASFEEFIASPVAGIRSVERRTWARLLLLLMTAAVVYLFLHPTAWYKTQLYFTDCVTVPGKGGYQHQICKPIAAGHPFA